MLHNQSQTRTPLHSSFCKVYWCYCQHSNSSFCKVYWCYCQHFNTIIYKPSSAAWLKTQSAARSKLSSVLDKAFLACLAVKPIACNISTFSGDTALKQSNVKISLQYYSNYQTCLLILIECRYDSMGFSETDFPSRSYIRSTPLPRCNIVPFLKGFFKKTSSTSKTCFALKSNRDNQKIM